MVHRRLAALASRRTGCRALRRPVEFVASSEADTQGCSGGPMVAHLRRTPQHPGKACTARLTAGFPASGAHSAQRVPPNREGEREVDETVAEEQEKP